MIKNPIILGCQKGEAKSQAALVKKYAGILMPVCRRYAPDNAIAHDALQDCFVNIFKYIKGYTGKGNFEGWMKRIAVNCALAYHKKKQYYTEIDNVVTHPSVGPSVYAEMGEREILEVLKKLPKGCYIVFNMYVIDGYSHREIAEELGISESSSRSQLKRARERIIRILEQQKKTEHKKIAIMANK